MTLLKTIRETRSQGKRHISNRSSRGSAAFELAAGALITIAIVAFALNTCFAMVAYGINDHACRDAARAAAQGTTPPEAFMMANAIVKSYNNTAAGMTPITLVLVSYVDFNGSPPPGSAPTVTVITRTSTKLPAPIELFGKKLFGQQIPLEKTYTFPIVRLKPAET
ncbi:MAG: hypothetical protein K2X77_00670 [Candidatus Obscuribacterales bacterium]|nr:hypothetical protein [Candidatus Obscuribacterales bacterium]